MSQILVPSGLIHSTINTVPCLVLSDKIAPYISCKKYKTRYGSSCGDGEYQQQTSYGNIFTKYADVNYYAVIDYQDHVPKGIFPSDERYVCDGQVCIGLYCPNQQWYPGMIKVSLVDARKAKVIQSGKYYYTKDVIAYWWDNITVPPSVFSMSIPELLDFLYTFSTAKRYNYTSWENPGLTYNINQGGITIQEPIYHDSFRVCEQYMSSHLTLEGQDGLSLAYWNMIDNLPMSSINWISSLIEAAGAVISILYGDYKTTAKSLIEIGANAWLAYRYQYLTTKSDIEDFRRLRQRVKALQHLCRENCTVRGFIIRNGITYRCSAVYSVTQLLGISDLDMYLTRMLRYDCWDMVPFSFMVDWFVNIGELNYDVGLHNIEAKLEPSAVSYSIEYDSSDAFGHFCNYTRLLSYVPKSILLYDDYLNYKETSTKTALYHLADGAAILARWL